MLSETTAISILISAEYAKAKTSKKVIPTLKPDWDNIGKIVSDALAHELTIWSIITYFLCFFIRLLWGSMSCG